MRSHGCVVRRARRKLSCKANSRLCMKRPEQRSRCLSGLRGLARTPHFVRRAGSQGSVAQTHEALWCRRQGTHGNISATRYRYTGVRTTRYAVTPLWRRGFHQERPMSLERLRAPHTCAHLVLRARAYARNPCGARNASCERARASSPRAALDMPRMTIGQT